MPVKTQLCVLRPGRGIRAVFGVCASSIWMFALPPPAHAGYYYLSAQYGGTITMTPWSGNASTLAYGNGQNGYGAYGSATRSVNCSGTITSVFTWFSYGTGDDPPDTAIATETCTASYGGYNNPTGTANNGLGFSEVNHVSSGTKYSALAGAGTVTITCSPSATVSGGPGTVFASVWYSVRLDPVVVSLSGGIGSSFHPSFLIGQGVTASLGSVLVPDSYSWSIGGAISPFADYYTTYTTPPGPSEPDSSHYVAVTVFNADSLHFYPAKPTFGVDASVTCTAHLTVPSGALPTGGLTATAHRNFVVDKPLYAQSVFIGLVRYEAGPPAQMLLTDQTYNGQTRGINWVTRVTTPASYSPSGWAWNFTQINTPNRYRTYYGVSQSYSLNGLTGLDTTFGYDPLWPNLYPDDGTEIIDGDSPGRVFGTGETYFSYNGSYRTYTLYRPPGNDWKLVPLKEWEWYCAGQADLIGGAWVVSNTAAQWSFDDDFPPHPIWTRRNDTSLGSWIP